MSISTELIESISAQFGMPVSRADLFQERLGLIINELIINDFARLVQILYRLDISESRLNEMLSSQHQRDAGEIIATLVIEREREKIKSRQQLKSDENIPDEDKW